MKKIIFTLMISILSGTLLFAQGTSGEEAKYEYRYLIDMPTTGILEKGIVGVTNDVLPNGVVVSRLEVGVFDGVSFGISYGGSNIIGSGSVDWYKYPGVNLRIRILTETLSFPNLTLGFDSQGKGEYFDDDDRFAVKSPGFFGSLSKNFKLLGYLSLHGTLNYSLESDDGDNFPNVMIGAEKTIGKQISAIIEYDFAFNDDKNEKYGKGNGYLNLGFRWSVGEGFTVGLDLRDMLNNKKWSPGSADRAIRLEYIRSIQ
ncbi:MAG: hypothetical protein STSR0008_12820 [Ignavibacterium sp.]